MKYIWLVTGMLQFGSSHPVGHIDFYPNGGGANESAQPGCLTQSVRSLIGSGFVEPARRLVACSHMRSFDYFIASIQQENCFTAAHCPSWSDFESGKCSCEGNQCAMMGIAADEYKKFLTHKDSLKFYLKTADSAPFCCKYIMIVLNPFFTAMNYAVQQYLLTVELSHYQVGVAYGNLRLTFLSSNGESKSISVDPRFVCEHLWKLQSIIIDSRSQELLPFKTYQYVISLPIDFKLFPSVFLKFEQQSKFFGLFKSSKVPVISRFVLKTMRIG